MCLPLVLPLAAPHKDYFQIVSCDKGIALLRFVVLANILSSQQPPHFFHYSSVANVKILYPLLVGSRRDPNKEIPDFGSQRDPKVGGSHSFGSRRDPKTEDLTMVRNATPESEGDHPSWFTT